MDLRGREGGQEYCPARLTVTRAGYGTPSVGLLQNQSVSVFYKDTYL